MVMHLIMKMITPDPLPLMWSGETVSALLWGSISSCPHAAEQPQSRWGSSPYVWRGRGPELQGNLTQLSHHCHLCHLVWNWWKWSFHVKIYENKPSIETLWLIATLVIPLRPLDFIHSFNCLFILTIVNSSISFFFFFFFFFKSAIPEKADQDLAGII